MRIVMLFIDLMATRVVFVLLLCFAFLASTTTSAAATHSECGESPTLKYREYAKKIGNHFFLILFFQIFKKKKSLNLAFFGAKVGNTLSWLDFWKRKRQPNTKSWLVQCKPTLNASSCQRFRFESMVMKERELMKKKRGLKKKRNKLPL